MCHISVTGPAGGAGTVYVGNPRLTVSTAAFDICMISIPATGATFTQLVSLPLLGVAARGYGLTNERCVPAWHLDSPIGACVTMNDGDAMCAEEEVLRLSAGCFTFRITGSR